MPPPQDTWSNATTPVANGGNGVDFDIQTYTAEDYEHIAVDLFERVRKPFEGPPVGDYADHVAPLTQGV